MNRPIVIALFQDAFAQVVDNLVFRMLMWILIALVLPTFLIQLNPDSIRILFAFEYRYDQVLGMFGGIIPGGAGAEGGDTHINLIEFIQRLVSDHLAGKVGVLLCVTATAFFIPRMLEKGAADTVFSKPVSRLTLMLSRYIAGLIFITVLSVGLIGGMHLGFSLVSGHSMQGFLWSIPMLIYLFAIMHAFSVMVGVFTRSSVAAILLTVVLFFVNSCIHQGWEVKQIATDTELLSDLGEEEFDLDELPAFMKWVGVALDAAHYTLPKTRDARRIAELAREQIASRGAPDRELFDPESLLIVPVAPSGFVRVGQGSLADGDAIWSAPAKSADAGAARIKLTRREPGSFGSRKAEATALEADVRERRGVSALDTLRTAIANRSGHGLRWNEARGLEVRYREHWFFENKGWLFELDIDVDEGRDGDEFRTDLGQFTNELRFEDDPQFSEFDPRKVYTERFGWGAKLPYNAWFSIASTLAFIFTVLLLGWLRLRRIDF